MKRTKSQMRRVFQVLELIREGRQHADAYAALSAVGGYRRYHNCETMALELEVSSKTIQRDLDFLRDEFGAPIEYSAPGKGYYLAEAGFSLSCGITSEQSLNGLLMSEAVLRAMGLDSLADSLKGIGDQAFVTSEATVASKRSAIGALVAPVGKTEIPSAVWKAVQRGLTKSQRLLLTQAVGFGRQDIFRFDPYQLVVEGQGWYIVGTRHNMGMASSFCRLPLAQIVEAHALSTTFTAESPSKWEANAKPSGVQGELSLEFPDLDAAA